MAKLRAALDGLVARHEALRAKFISGPDGDVIQLVGPAARLDVRVVDLSELGDGAEIRAIEIVNQEVERRFDLAVEPPLRGLILRLAENEHVLALTFHHIACDGWSLDVLARDLSELYRAAVRGQSCRLPPLELQYGDFAAWQRQWLSGERLDTLLAYWRDRLDGAPQVLDLPTDRPRGPVRSMAGDRVGFELSEELSASLKRLSGRNGVTTFMVFLAAFQALLSRHCGVDDVVVGSPVAARTRAEIEELIGFFVNTLLLRTDLSGHPTFTQLLTRVREVAVGAYANQDLPFERLVQEIAPERSLARSELFQVMFAFQNAPGEVLSLEGVEVDAFPFRISTAKFDLTLAVSEEDRRFVGELSYATDLFDRSTIERLASHFTNLLEAVVANPDTPLSELEILSPAERHQLLVEYNDTTTDIPDATVAELFAAQAATSPEATAVVFGDHRLTYRELDESSNRLAHHLVALGVGAETLVGICVERSAEMVVGLLAILKAGGAYVPLDPDYPHERLSFMLDDTSAPVLLSQASLAGRFENMVPAVVCVDTDAGLWADQPSTAPPPTAGPDNLAYVIYTSGSTGVPKGVMIEHRSVVGLVFADYASLGPMTVTLQAASASFDAATFELWGPLLHGGVCVLLEQKPTPATLKDAIERHRVTTVWLTASLFNVVIDNDARSLAGVSEVLTGGEALSVEHVRRAVEVLSDTRIINGYGPTETTTFAATYPIPAVLSTQTVPIGRPIANTTVYVLDADRRLVPIGVPGELYIGGVGLARGYLNRPELTAERFVANPFSDEPSSRLYRTGDRVRWLADGNLEFLGRFDHQVKIRGYRIECGEVEAALLGHPDIAEAAVVARDDTGSGARLVAYVVSRDGLETPAATDLRAHLRKTLPDWMVPSAFVALEALPLTRNAKLDRDALPAPDARPDVGQYVAPRNETEQILADIWAEVLGVERVGVTDNFFEIGGHSLVATRAVARVHSRLGRCLVIEDLFELPTVAGCAERIAVNVAKPGDTDFAPIPILERPRP